MKRNIDFFYTTFVKLALIFMFMPLHSVAQVAQGTKDAYLLTCEPHDEVYSLYGHTAIRLVDSDKNIDVAVNYGVFDSSKSFFVLRFIFGLTDYSVAIYPTELFLREYEYYGSKVTQQRLNLTEEEKDRLFSNLFENARPENREYRYNFFYNNCTTKARDMILDVLDAEIVQLTDKKDITFRELIHSKNHDYPWAKFGNDILLGVKADAKATESEEEFLPENLMYNWDNTFIVKDGNKRKLVSSSETLLPHGQQASEPMQGFPLTPTATFAILLAIALIVTVIEHTTLHRRIVVFDALLFASAGLAGIILFLMIFSAHPTVNVNLQILLLSPLCFLMLFRGSRKVNTLIIILTILFFLGNAIQDYAEGMNLLALCLLARVLNKEYFGRLQATKGKEA